MTYETRRQLDLIYDAIAADPVKPYTLDEHVNARNAAIGFSRHRSSNVGEQLAATSAGRN
jgi:hypothetical protein